MLMVCFFLVRIDFLQAPEALIAHDQTTLSAQSGDIWSAGVLLLQLCSRRSANCFEQPRDLHALLRYDIEQQRMGALDVYRSYSDSYFVSLLADIPNCVLSLLVLRMLIPDPALRPSASECLKQLLELPGVAEIVSSEPSRAATQTALQLTDFAFSDHL
jgi:serine/threonine protein kinase